MMQNKLSPENLPPQASFCFSRGVHRRLLVQYSSSTWASRALGSGKRADLLQQRETLEAIKVWVLSPRFLSTDADTSFRPQLTTVHPNTGTSFTLSFFSSCPLELLGSKVLWPRMAVPTVLGILEVSLALLPERKSWFCSGHSNYVYLFLIPGKFLKTQRENVLQTAWSRGRWGQMKPQLPLGNTHAIFISSPQTERQALS